MVLRIKTPSLRFECFQPLPMPSVMVSQLQCWALWRKQGSLTIFKQCCSQTCQTNGPRSFPSSLKLILTFLLKNGCEREDQGAKRHLEGRQALYRHADNLMVASMGYDDARGLYQDQKT